MITVEVVLARTRSSLSRRLKMAAGSTAEQAAAESGLPLQGVTGYAVYGERVAADTPLEHGDRLELLRPLQMDPKEARRRRAARGRPDRQPR